jgi:hypothetical protein
LTLILSAIGTAVGLAVFCGCGFFILIVGAADQIQRQLQGRANPDLSDLIALGAGFLVQIGIGVIGYLVFQGLYLAGMIYCTSAPRKHDARTMAQIALGLHVGSLVLFVVLFLIGFSQGFTQAAGGQPFGQPAEGGVNVLGTIMQGISNFLGLAGTITFLLFLRATALGVESPGLAQSISYLIGVAVAFGLCLFGMMGLTLLAGGGAPRPGARADGLASMTAGCGCLFIILALTFVIWWLVTLFQVRGAVDRFVRRYRNMGMGY